MIVRSAFVALIFPPLVWLACRGDEKHARPPSMRLDSTVLLDSVKASAIWSSNTEPDLAGYKIYCGTAPRTYSKATTIFAPNTTAVVHGLDWNTTYYFAATAFDTAGNESGYSNEVTAMTPAKQTGKTDTTITAESALFDCDKNGAARVIENGVVVFALKGQNSWVSLNYPIMDTVDVSVLARGDSALGVWPIMRLAFGLPTNMIAAEIVRNSTFISTIFKNQSPAGAMLYLVFPNDVWEPGIYDRNLYIRSVTLTSSTMPDSIARFDLNGDRAVNVLDWIWLLRHIGYTGGNVDYRTELDFNADGWIDGMDKAFFARESKFI